jgi:hypothetical protein
LVLVLFLTNFYFYNVFIKIFFEFFTNLYFLYIFFNIFKKLFRQIIKKFLFYIAFKFKKINRQIEFQPKRAEHAHQAHAGGHPPTAGDVVEPMARAHRRHRAGRHKRVGEELGEQILGI